MRTIFPLLFVVIISVSACAPNNELAPSSFPLTRIQDIAANPSSFNGDLLLIRGTAVVEFEGDFVCPSASIIAEGGDPKQCLWLTTSETSDKPFDLSPFHLKKVELLGHVNPHSEGYMRFAASFQVSAGRVIGDYGKKDFRPSPPPPPPSSAN